MKAVLILTRDLNSYINPPNWDLQSRISARTTTSIHTQEWIKASRQARCQEDLVLHIISRMGSQRALVDLMLETNMYRKTISSSLIPERITIKCKLKSTTVVEIGKQQAQSSPTWWIIRKHTPTRPPVYLHPKAKANHTSQWMQEANTAPP